MKIKFLHIQKLKNKPEALIFTIAIVIGLIGAGIKQAGASAMREEIQSALRVKQIVVAASDLKKGQVLRSEDLRAGEILSRNESKNMVQYAKKEELIGMKIETDLYANDPLLLSNVTGEFDTKAVAERIPPGKRLFTMNLTDAAAKNGFVRPGDSVDILCVMDVSAQGTKAFTILSNIKVISVGTVFESNSGVQSSQISYFVTPEQMETLIYAETKGKFKISLRSPLDTQELTIGPGVNEETFQWSKEFRNAAQPDAKIKVSK